jgi:protein-tyrosine-phosphatase
MTYDIVFVCSGNRFRSPLAAAVLQRAAETLPVEVLSMGTLDLEPGAALPGAVTAAARYGLDLGEHRSRPLRGADLSDTDLVVGFQRIHVATAVVDGGAARERAFMLTELVQLLAGQELAGHGIERARSAVASAARARSTQEGVVAAEIHDPIGRPRAVADQIADEVRELTERLATQLFGL